MRNDDKKIQINIFFSGRGVTCKLNQYMHFLLRDWKLNLNNFDLSKESI